MEIFFSTWFSAISSPFFFFKLFSTFRFSIQIEKFNRIYVGENGPFNLAGEECLTKNSALFLIFRFKMQVDLVINFGNLSPCGKYNRKFSLYQFSDIKGEEKSKRMIIVLCKQNKHIIKYSTLTYAFCLKAEIDLSFT